MIIRNWSDAARYGLPGLILGVAVSWIGGARGPEAAAQSGLGSDSAIPAGRLPRLPEPVRSAQPQTLASGESGGTMAFVTSAAGSTQWLYLVDTKARALAVYRVDPMNAKGVLKLEAARQYQFDLRLEHYNNLPPEPSAIEATVKAPSQAGRTSGSR